MGQETELCFFAQVTKPEGFDQAVSMQMHDQFEYKIPSETGEKKKERVRKVTVDGNVSYELTIKLYKDINGMLSAFEPTVQISEEYYNAWIEAFADKGMSVIRYVFLSTEVTLEAESKQITLPEVKYEVDILLNAQGQRSKWCKVDIEIDKILEYLAANHEDIKKFDMTVALSKLPIGLENAFSAVTEDENERQAIATFFEKFAIPAKREVS